MSFSLLLSCPAEWLWNLASAAERRGTCFAAH